MGEEPEPPWIITARKKKAEQQLLLDARPEPATWSQQNEIVSTRDSSVLLRNIAAGTWSAETVIAAYCTSAAEAHLATNCLTEICFESALEHARKLDEYLATNKRTTGPLHGLPISLKDQFNIRGFDSTLGYVGRCNQPAKEDAVLVQILKHLGAVVFVKTNLPQSIMWCETNNPLWGVTTHPRHSDLTPAGSSGGEAALIAMRGSLAGFGTDLGGSVRMPAHMTGVYGFKPSSGRLPYAGVSVSTEGQEHIPSVVGPMAASFSTIKLLAKSILSAEPWKLDAQVLPIPWRQEKYDQVQARPLTIGVIYDDGVVRIHPPIERVMKEACAALEALGHEVVPWEVSGHEDGIRIMDRYYTADGGEDVRRDVEAGGEPFVPHVAALVNKASALSVWEYWQLNREKFAAQQAQLKKWIAFRSPRGRQVDVVLSPTMPHVAVEHQKCRWVGYTKVWNLFNRPVVTIPAGKVDSTMDAEHLPAYQPRNEMDEWNWNLWDYNKMLDLPIGLQVIGWRLEEESLLGAVEVIDDAINKIGLSAQEANK